MDLYYSQHAVVRTQQRGIPTVVSSWLVDYGDEVFDGRGGVVRYFTPQTIRMMEHDIGSLAVKRMAEFLRCYLVQRSDDGEIITVGKRYSRKHIWRH
jgi:hypothetical protein